MFAHNHTSTQAREHAYTWTRIHDTAVNTLTAMTFSCKSLKSSTTNETETINMPTSMNIWCLWNNLYNTNVNAFGSMIFGSTIGCSFTECNDGSGTFNEQLNLDAFFCSCTPYTFCIDYTIIDFDIMDIDNKIEHWVAGKWNQYSHLHEKFTAS